MHFNDKKHKEENLKNSSSLNNNLLNNLTTKSKQKKGSWKTKRSKNDQSNIHNLNNNIKFHQIMK